MKRLMWATTLSVAFVAAMSLGAQSAQEPAPTPGFGMRAGSSVTHAGTIDGLAFDELGSGAWSGHRPGVGRMGGRVPLGAKPKD